MSKVTNEFSEEKTSATKRELWWKWMDTKVGIIPVPIYFVLAALLIAFNLVDGVTGELAMVIAISVFFAFTLGEVGNRIPGLRSIGGGAILVTFLPSLLGHLGWVPVEMEKALGDFYKSSKLLNLFIAAVIVGSIMSMERALLIKGFVKIFVPLISGTACALILGMGAGTLLGLTPSDTFFYVLAPVMAGGVGEGAVPLSIGYASIAGIGEGDVLARILPPIVIGNLTAVICAGVLHLIGNKKPHLTGNGQLNKTGADEVPHTSEMNFYDIPAIASAFIVATTLYLIGVLANEVFDWPAPVVMLAFAVLLTLAHGVSPNLRSGSYFVYKFALTAVAFPVLFIFSLIMIPWDALVAGFAPPILITVVVSVLGMIGGGFWGARWVNLNPIEAALITSTHSGMGGAGDVAILTASKRMQLMPFAQIATRIGGGITVVIALVLFGLFA